MLMVQIASKSMVLNVKTGQRLVDDCVSPTQRELMQAAKRQKDAEADGTTPAPQASGSLLSPGAAAPARAPAAASAPMASPAGGAASMPAAAAPMPAGSASVPAAGAAPAPAGTASMPGSR